MKILCLLLIILLIVQFICGKKVISGWDQSSAYNLFANDLYNAIAEDALTVNIVISPAAVQCSMALAYYGAKGNTATEMAAGLRFETSNTDNVINRFSEFQNSFSYDSNYINLYNRIYINENLEFKGKFKEIAINKFKSNIEKADFHPPYNKRTAERINREVELKMNGKIKDILQAQQLNDSTEGIIINAVTFDGPWQKGFQVGRTGKRQFSNNGRQNVKVDFMWAQNNYRYGEFNNLNAKILELPYQNNDYSMIIILPNRKDGLKDVQQKLKGVNIPQLLNTNLTPQEVEVLLPKFSITYGVTLKTPFEKLGVTNMFTTKGDFGNMYRMFVTHYINSVNHNAYVEISENGSESPTNGNNIGLKLFSMTKKFDVNHPFVFAIKYQNSIIFIGHIVHL